MQKAEILQSDVLGIKSLFPPFYKTGQITLLNFRVLVCKLGVNSYLSVLICGLNEGENTEQREWVLNT